MSNKCQKPTLCKFTHLHRFMVCLVFQIFTELRSNKYQLFPRQNLLDVMKVASRSNFRMSVANLPWIWKLFNIKTWVRGSGGNRECWGCHKKPDGSKIYQKLLNTKILCFTQVTHELPRTGHMETLQWEAPSCVHSAFPYFWPLSATHEIPIW